MLSTTNIELIDLTKDRSLSNFHCICKYEMNQCLTNNTSINIIVNFNNSDNDVNWHWCLSFINDDQNVYYSSFRNPIL